MHILVYRNKGLGGTGIGIKIDTLEVFSIHRNHRGGTRSRTPNGKQVLNRTRLRIPGIFRHRLNIKIDPKTVVTDGRFGREIFKSQLYSRVGTSSSFLDRTEAPVETQDSDYHAEERINRGKTSDTLRRLSLPRR